ncbi:hypothetical protein IC229_07960 [Spirosoma sp. BT702]|uniref:Uncharacterized protein n=1 Tax=Spirosoma profusum TaxID=2771354 RepID=A0A926Y1Y1_9BACT|nr:hypothetical protein [Spirosoma profusum]MBD2700565.1 hypothetical protein [Spirosoma profusum]
MAPLLTSLRQTLGSFRLLWLIYGITLVLGLVVALPFYSTFSVETQHSLAFQELLNGFDYTVFSDFWHRSKPAIRPLISVGRWLGLLYLFLSVFLAGGILLRFAQPNTRFDVGTFWQGCTHYVGRFMRLLGATLLFAVISGSIWLIAGSLVGFGLSDDVTERGQLWIGSIFFGFFALTVTLVFCIGDYAKVILFREDQHSALRAFGLALRLVLRHPGKTYGLYLLLILIGTGLFGLYFLIDSVILMSGWLTILLMFIIQQTLVFARVGLKVWALGTAYHVYGSLPKPEPVLRSQPIVTPVQATATVSDNPESPVE